MTGREGKPAPFILMGLGVGLGLGLVLLGLGAGFEGAEKLRSLAGLGPVEGNHAQGPEGQAQLSAVQMRSNSQPLAVIVVPAEERVELAAPGHLSGVVLDPHGEPLADAEIGLEECTGGTGQHRLRSGEAGEFSIEVAKGSAWNLLATHNEYGSNEPLIAFSGEHVVLTLQLGGELRVLVRGPAGQPLPDASVWVSPFGGGNWKREGSTDAGGLLRLVGLPPGDLSVGAKCFPYVRGWTRVMVHAGQDYEAQVDLAAGCTIHGQVVEASSGVPVPGAQVESEHLGRVTADADGRFQFPGVRSSPTTVGFLASASGFALDAQYTKIVDPEAEYVLRFELPQELRVRGKIVGPDGQPLAGTRVSFQGGIPTHPFTEEHHTGTAVTDAFGVFELAQWRRDGLYHLVVESADQGTGNFTVGPFPGDQEEVDLGEFSMFQAASIQGTVSCGRLPNPRLARVRLTRLDQPSLASQQERLVDAEGYFTFLGLAPGDYDLALLPPQIGMQEEVPLALARVQLGPGQMLRDFVLSAPPQRLRGVAVDSTSRPIRGLHVVLHPPGKPNLPLSSARTDDSGAFELLAASSGPFDLLLEDPTSRLAPQGVTDVRLGGVPLTVRMEPLLTDFSIVGQLESSDKQPVTNVYVSLVATETGISHGLLGMPNTQGKFEVHNLPHAAYHLEAVDFSGRYHPCRLADVQASGQPVQMILRKRD